MALDGHGHLFVLDQANGSIGEYTTEGETVNASLISGLGVPAEDIALDGHGNIFVVNAGSRVVSQYTTSGETVNASLITGLLAPSGLALDGEGHLFVVSGTVGKYTTSGTLIAANFVSGNNPIGLLVLPTRPTLNIKANSFDALLGTITLVVENPTAATLVIEGTEDFLNWVPVATNAPVSQVEIDVPIVSLQRGFYRTRTQ